MLVGLDLSRARLLSGDAERAEAAADAVLKDAPGHGRGLYRRGVARFRRGDAKNAADDLARALAADAGPPHDELFRRLTRRGDSYRTTEWQAV